MKLCISSKWEIILKNSLSFIECIKKVHANELMHRNTHAIKCYIFIPVGYNNDRHVEGNRCDRGT